MLPPAGPRFSGSYVIPFDHRIEEAEQDLIEDSFDWLKVDLTSYGEVYKTKSLLYNFGETGALVLCNPSDSLGWHMDRELEKRLWDNFPRLHFQSDYRNLAEPRRDEVRQGEIKKHVGNMVRAKSINSFDLLV